MLTCLYRTLFGLTSDQKKKPGHDIYKEEDEPAETVLSNIVEAVGQELELVNKRLAGDKN